MFFVEPLTRVKQRRPKYSLLYDDGRYEQARLARFEQRRRLYCTRKLTRRLLSVYVAVFYYAVGLPRDAIRQCDVIMSRLPRDRRRRRAGNTRRRCDDDTWTVVEGRHVRGLDRNVDLTIGLFCLYRYLIEDDLHAATRSTDISRWDF